MGHAAEFVVRLVVRLSRRLTCPVPWASSLLSPGRLRPAAPLGFLAWLMLAAAVLADSGQPGPTAPAVVPDPATQALPTSGVLQVPDRSAGGNLQPIEGAQVVGRVGSEVILAADVLQGWEGFLAANGEKIPPSELDRVRTEYMKRQFKELLDTKFLYSDARRKIPAENFPKIEESLAKKFDTEQMERLYESTRTRHPAELDAKLREMGTTLEQRKRNFVESVLARQWLQQQIDVKGDVPYERLWRHYQENLASFQYPARAKWEEIMIRFDRCQDRVEAYRRLAALGNMVLAEPARFGQIAREHSHGVTAEDGGQHDWTTQGSLVALSVDQAVFSLPLNALSQPLVSDVGFHIVRVLERTAAGCKPFEEAQAEIREQIEQRAREEKFTEYLGQLRRTVPVWSVFDPPSEATVGRRDGGPPLR